MRRLVLDQLYVGELDVAPGEEMQVVEYEDDLAEGQFYQVLKRRVEKYFRGNQARCSQAFSHLSTSRSAASGARSAATRSAGIRVEVFPPEG